MLKVSTRFPRTWWILSNTALDMEFPEVLGLAVIQCSISIRDFRSSWPINSFPWSYVIYIGLGYLDSHVVSTKFDIDIALLSSYCAISNHNVTGSVIVMYFRCKFYFLYFILMTEGTQSLFHGISSANLASNLPYFIFDRFVRL